MLHFTKKDQIVIVSLKEESKIYVSNAEKIKSRLLELIENHNDKIIFNLQGIKFIDSSGFAAIINAFNLAKNKKYQFKFCNITPEVKELLEVTKLDSVLEVCESLDACIREIS